MVSKYHGIMVSWYQNIMVKNIFVDIAYNAFLAQEY